MYVRWFYITVILCLIHDQEICSVNVSARFVILLNLACAALLFTLLNARFDLF
nr:MAG TPA_asm: hypothetical protein [Caudoviricetes sp.]DAL37733.1 MAG TPA_asm: hypothetical protein [Caudoviricetes sp.]